MVLLMGGYFDGHFEKYLNTPLQNMPVWHMYYFDVKKSSKKEALIFPL